MYRMVVGGDNGEEMKVKFFKFAEGNREVSS